MTEVQKKSSRIYHYLTGVGVAILGGIISTIATCEKAPTVVRGVVLEEKHVPATGNSVVGEEKESPTPKLTTEKKESGKQEYMLHLKVYEPAKEGREIERLCAFYIKEDAEMPIAVLDDVISAGSEVYVHYYGSGLTLHTLEPLYKIGCFGSASSAEIKVVHPWESSEAVKKSLEDKLESIRKKELERIKAEARKFDLGRTVY